MLLLSLLAGCGDDLGDMTERAAVRSCHEYVVEHHVGEDPLHFLTSLAKKDDRYWEVSGETDRGTYRCTVNAVEHETFTALYDD